MKIFKLVLLVLLTGVVFFSCEKEYSYENGNINLTTGTWQFQNNTVQYNGNIDSAAIQSVSSTKVLTLAGKSLSGQEIFRIRLYTTDSFTTTSYAASLSASTFDYATPSKTIFKGDFLAGEFVVNITSLSNNTITGTFSGEAEDSTGSSTQITLGTFTSSIDLRNNGSGQVPQSAGTLGANPDTCTSFIISGVYKAGTVLSAANTIQVQVNVTAPGSFIIASNSVNGINFFKSGIFNTTGLQNVLLVGNGTPQNPGNQTFTVTYGNSNCIFAVNCLPGTLPSADYFPLTVNSNWVYGLTFGGSTDSILSQASSYAPIIGANVYATFISNNIPPFTTPDTGYFRKFGDDYYTYTDVSDIFGFNEPVKVEYRFLNDAEPAGTTYRSPDFSGTILGLPVSGYIQVTIKEKAVPETVGALAFPDVIKVTYDYYISALPGTPFASEERWFARGVGLIYDNIDNTYILNIGRYVVR